MGRKRLWSRAEHTLQGLAADGLLMSDIWPTISSLAELDYSSGPVPDDDPSRSGEVWIFGPDVRGEVVYVKLKLIDDLVECLSFHSAGYPLSYPLRNMP